MPPSGPTYNNNSYSGGPPVAQPVPQQPPKKGRFGGLGTTVGLPVYRYCPDVVINTPLFRWHNQLLVALASAQVRLHVLFTPLDGI
jgi:hypothetical protein